MSLHDEKPSTERLDKLARHDAGGTEMIFCPKHPRYLAVRKRRSYRCGRCYWLYLRKWWNPTLAVGRPVIHRRRDVA